jgi:DNA-binding transcriptional ArsR family regulator
VVRCVVLTSDGDWCENAGGTDSEDMATRPTGGTDVEGGPDSPRGRATGAIPTDETFALLQNQRRRTTLRTLRERGPELTHGELAEHVAARENDVAREAVTSVQRKRVYISLYQNHLPRLADAGAVTYDPGRGDVALDGPSETLFAHLDLVDGADGDGSSDTPFLLLLGANAAVVVALSLPFTPASLAALLFVGLFTAAAVRLR